MYTYIPNNAQSAALGHCVPHIYGPAVCKVNLTLSDGRIFSEPSGK